MSLEQVLMQAYDFVTQTPIKATLDLSGHAMAGYFLVQRYFPEAPKSMKALLGAVGGFAPDFDYLTLGAISHKGITHTGAFGAALASLMFYFNKEDWLKTSLSNTKRMLASRYVKLAGLGVALHLGMDNLHLEPGKLGYCAVIGGLVILQNMVNKKQNRYEPKEDFKMHPCVVIDGAGKKYFAAEGFHSEHSEEFLKEDEKWRKEFGMPQNDIPVYNIPSYEFRKDYDVREHQKIATRDAKTIFRKVDERILGFFRPVRAD